MSRLLRCFACIFALLSVSSVYAAGYTCDSSKKYTSCSKNYYMTKGGTYNGTPQAGNACTACPTGCSCAGGTAAPACNVTVTLNKNGGTGTVGGASGTANGTVNCSNGVDCTLPTTGLTKSGYTFVGWSTSSSCASIADSCRGYWGTGKFTAATTLYAVWAKNPTIANARWTGLTTGQAYNAYVEVTPPTGYSIDRVQFPTWTDYNGQDDIQPNWQTNTAASGRKTSARCLSTSKCTYYYNVKFADHNNEISSTAFTQYFTHIYAYASNGGVVMASVSPSILKCDAGNYLPANASACATCPAGYYCYAGVYAKSSTAKGNDACPDPTEYKTTTYPASYHTVKSITAATTSWATGAKTETECMVNYTITNERGSFQVESVSYNDDDGEYNNGLENMYYNSVNPGYYLKTRYADNYCSTTAEFEKRMLYRAAEICPAGSYCPGVTSMPTCTSGTYNTELGRNSCPGTTATVESITTWGGSPASNLGNTSINACLAVGKALSDVNGTGTYRCYYTSGSGSTAVYNTDCHLYHYNSCKGGRQMTKNGTYNATPQDDNACTPCGTGKYGTGGTTACKACGANETTRSTTASSVDLCLCKAGFGGSGKGTGCTACAAGTYKTRTGNAACSICTANYYCTGGTNRTECSTLGAIYGHSDAGAGAATKCYAITPVGMELYPDDSMTEFVNCYEGEYCPGNIKVFYGDEGGWETCSNLGKGAYRKSETNSTSPEDCYADIAKGSYLDSADEALKKCTSGQYCPGGTVYYPDVLPAKLCSALPHGLNKQIISTGNYLSVAPYDAATTCRYNSGAIKQAHPYDECDDNGLCMLDYACTFTSNTMAYNGNYYPDQTYSGNVKAGWYVTQNNTSTASCSQCVAGSYSAGGSVTSCSQCAAGTFSAAAGSASCTKCVAGSFSARGATGCTACQNGYTSQTGNASCNLSCPETFFKEDSSVPSDIGSKSIKTWETATWNKNNTVTNACIAKSCNVGYYKKGNSCSRCHDFANGLYPYSADGTTGGQEACYARRRSLNGSYIANARDTTATACPAGTYSFYLGGDTGNLIVHYGETYECDSCPLDTYTAVTGSTSCTSCAVGYTTGQLGASSALQCAKICAGGSYIAKAGDATCTNVGAGYWAAASSVTQGSAGTRNACPAGETTIGYGTGANEANDCGRVMNVGNTKLYLRKAKATTPALNVNVGGTTYYGNMSTADKNMSAAATNKLKLSYGNSTYSVYDDSADAATISVANLPKSMVPASLSNTSFGWSVTFANGETISGTADCDVLIEDIGVDADYDWTPDHTPMEVYGRTAGCWCHILGGEYWVSGGPANYCFDQCAYNCASAMASHSASGLRFKRNLYWSVGHKQF